ncbi:MAG TPA: hypothetical protein VKP30_07870 [Polyangiaceae bacterium]|nr:hypothetical protein [Polyangiaceae bacterium]
MLETEEARHESPTGSMFRHAPSSSFRVSGADTLDWLDRMLTGDLRAQGREAQRSLCLDRTGKIHGELLCWLGRQEADLVLTGGDRGEVVDHLSRHIIMEDVAVEVTTKTLYSCHGQDAVGIASQLASMDGVRSEQLLWLLPNDCVWLVPAEQEPEWLSRVGSLGITVGDAEVWEQLRISSGLPRFGRDYTSSDTPSVAGLVSELVSQTKGCYLGQEVVCRTVMRGSVREQVTRLKFEQAPSPGATIGAATGELIGTVTSVARLTTQGAWAIGRVKTNAIEASGPVTADGITGQISPRVLTA